MLPKRIRRLNKNRDWIFHFLSSDCIFSRAMFWIFCGVYRKMAKSNQSLHIACIAQLAFNSTSFKCYFGLKLHWSFRSLSPKVVDNPTDWRSFFLTQPMAKRLKLFGIIYLVGKIRRSNGFFFQGPGRLSEISSFNTIWVGKIDLDDLPFEMDRVLNSIILSWHYEILEEYFTS